MTSARRVLTGQAVLLRRGRRHRPSSRTSRRERALRGRAGGTRAVRPTACAAVPDGGRDQRRVPRRRGRARVALQRAHDLERGPALRFPRGVPRPVPRLGRHAVVAATRRPGDRDQGDRREPAAAEPDARRAAQVGSWASQTGCSSRRSSWTSRSRSRSSWQSEPLERAQPDWSEAERSSAARGRTSTTQVHGAAPAPYTALDLIAGAQEWTVEEGYRREQEAIGRAAAGPAGAGVALRVRPRRATREEASCAARRRARRRSARSASSAPG